MSFYGKVYYQLENAFAKFFIRNSGKNKVEAPGETPDSSIDAIGLNSEFYLDTGNKWIRLKKDSSNNKDKCKFYHALLSYDEEKPDEFNSFTSFSKVDDRDNAPQLEPGNTIKIQNLKYDKAGHVSYVENKYFKLPITELDADLNTSSNDDFKLKFKSIIYIYNSKASRKNLEAFIL